LDLELIRLIKEELNVKSLRHEITLVDKIKLDEKITIELKEEGMIREVIRQIQEMRKKAGYKPRHRILVRYSGTPNLNKILNKNKNFIRKEAKVKNFRLGERSKQVFDIEREIKVDSQTLWLAIKKI
jgi:isoleucyl-tRNA synthetase